MTLIPSKGFRTMYTVREVAEFTGVPVTTVKSWIQRGLLARNNSSRFCIEQQDVNKFLQTINTGRMA